MIEQTCPKCGSALEILTLPVGVDILACEKTAKRKKPTDATTLCDYYTSIPEPKPPVEEVEEYEPPTVTELDAPLEEPQHEESEELPEHEDTEPPEAADDIDP